MNTSPVPMSTRVSRAWTACYTSGLDAQVASDRSAEIESDTAEHQAARHAEGFGPAQIAREQLWRVARGVPADLGWRHDLLVPTYRSTPAVRGAVLATTSAASLLVIAFHLVFAAYVLGDGSLSERNYVLGGMDYYADFVDNQPIFAVVLLVLALVLFCAFLARPLAPFSANIATAFISMWWVMWFWVRMWPIALIAIGASLIDMFLRAPNLNQRR